MRLFHAIHKSLIRWLIGKSTVIANANINMRTNIVGGRTNGIVYDSVFHGHLIFAPLFDIDVINCTFLPASVVWFVDVDNGNDANDGLTPKTAFATMSRAASSYQCSRDDTIFSLPRKERSQ